MQDEAAPKHAAVTEHKREQPDDPLGTGLVGEDGAEMRKIDLRLAPRRSLEPNLELRPRDGPDVAQKLGQDRVAAGIAEIAQFAMQPTTGQLRKGGDALAQIALELLQLCRPGLAGTVDRRLQATGDVSAHRLAVEPNAAGNRRNRDTLPMQFKNHNNLPKSDQRRAPLRKRDHHRS